MREIALAHARRGFKVFPITPGEKKPPLVGAWQNVATSDAAQIEQWWSQWPGANVGIHCDGLLVIDVDPKKGGFESLAALEQEVFLEATYEVETPSGGRHLYYRCAGGARNGVDVLGSGLDIRTTAGYVLAAGSVVAGREYRAISDEPIVDVERSVVERCRARVPAERDRVREDVRTDADAAVARTVDFLRTHPVAVQGAGGDHHTFRTVCRIRDFGVPQELALAALEDWNARCVPPWEDSELTVKVENAYAYAQDAAGKLTPEALGFEVVQEAAASTGGGQTQIENDRSQPENDLLLHPADVNEADVLKAEYHIKGVLERGSNAVAFGHWNVGKTFVVLDMGASIACGQPWFGRKVKKGGVLYLGYEGIRAMKKRILALREKYPLLKDKATPFEYASMIYPLVKDEGRSEMKARLKEFGRKHGKPDLVIIDPLANALGGDDSDATLMGELNAEVAKIMKANACTVLRVHHSGHGNQDRARGHSSLPAGVDTEIRISEDEIALTKQRDDAKTNEFFRLKKGVKVGIDTDGDPVTTCLVEQIEKNPLSADLTASQQSMLDALLKLRGDNGKVSLADIRACAPEGMTPKERTKIVAELERKQYLVPEGNKWVLAERGPMSMFD
jgi:hypothetical protein